MKSGLTRNKVSFTSHLNFISRAKVSSAGYQDFIGSHTLRASFERRKLNELLEALKNESPRYIWEFIFLKDSEKMARVVSDALRLGLLTLDQTATLLNQAQLAEVASSWQALPLNKDRAELLRFFLPKSEDQDSFWSLLKQLQPASEAYCYRVTIDLSSLKDHRILSLLLMAKNLKVLVFDEDQGAILNALLANQNCGGAAHLGQLSFYQLSAGALDVVTQVRYGDDAKKSIPRLGDLSLNDVEQGINKKSRYVAYHHPEVAITPIFHDVVAPIYYLSLHDELHRQLISSVPNSVYEAYLEAISLVRLKTGFYWSKELWKGIDLENGTFLGLSAEERSVTSAERVTKNFCRLLASPTYSIPEYVGLFNHEPEFLDTTWILMIDLYENKETWEDQYSIDSDYLTDEYKPLYELVKLHYPRLANKSSAEQVACLNAIYSGLSYTDTTKASYVKEKNYIQLAVNGRILGKSKALFIAEKKYEQAVLDLQAELQRMEVSRGLNDLQLKAKQVAAAIANEVKAPLTVAELEFFINSLNLTRQLLNPLNQRNESFLNDYKKLVDKGQGSIVSQVIGAMLVFLGAVMVAASLLATAVSAALLTPLVISGLVLGAGSILGGLGLFRAGMRQDTSTAMLEYDSSIQAQCSIGVKAA